MKINKNKLGGALACIAAVIALLVLTDLCIGGASAWLYHRSKYGIFHRQQYVLNESKDDIIIIGSSRASHHYVPSIITDSLGLSCYNAGSEGMCVYYHYAILASMINRGHCPKIVIYDVMDVDVRKHPGPTFTLEAALDRLAPHYGEFPCVDSLFALKDWKEKMKLLSMSYRYNSKLVQSVKCNYIPSLEDNGYEKVAGKLKDNVVFSTNEYDDCDLDIMKLNYFNKIIDIAKEKKITMLLVLSPKYRIESSKAIDTIKMIASKNNIPMFDFQNEPSLMKREFFRDVRHLNDNGAHIWTSFFSHILKDSVRVNELAF